jgi:hypothetical protein
MALYNCMDLSKTRKTSCEFAYRAISKKTTKAGKNYKVFPESLSKKNC